MPIALVLFTEVGYEQAADFRSRLYHPDRAPGNEAAFIRVREAYEVLTDPVKRYAYDRCV